MTDGPTAVTRGLTLLDLGRAQEAERHFRDALSQDPTDSGVHVHLAQALIRQQRHTEARDAARRALGLDPDNLAALLVLSAAHAGLREFDLGIQAVDRALQMAPDLPVLHRQAGALLLAQGNSQGALVALERARVLDPEDSLTLSTLAQALFEERRHAEAEAALAQALRLDPGSAEAHRVRSMFLLARGGGRAAVAASGETLRMDPTDAHSREVHALARKSRNPLYGLLLRLGEWQRHQPRWVQMLIIFSPFLATRLLRPYDDQVWARVLLVAVFAVVLVLWTIEPLMNSLLLATRRGRGLLRPLTARATTAFLAYLGTALVCTGVGLATDSTTLLFTTIGLALWSVSAGHVHLMEDSRLRVAVGLHAAGAVLAAVTVVLALLGTPAAVPLALVLMLSGVAMTWFTTFA